MAVKLNGGWKVASYVLVSLITVLMTVFIFVLRGNNAALKHTDRIHYEKIEHNTEDITRNKVKLGRYEAIQEDMSEDISEIKSDVKTLIAR